MTIEACGERAGVDVHLDPDECALLVRLAADAERVNRETDSPRVYDDASDSYLSLSLALGRRIQALARERPSVLSGPDDRALARAIIDLVLGPDTP